MKVLFVSSGNSKYGVVPFIKRQGESLIREGVDLEFYTIRGTGIKGYLKNIIPLRKHIKVNKCDILHAHYGLIGLVCLFTFTKIPLVLSVMGDDAYGSFNNAGKRIKSSYFEMFLTQIVLLFANQIIVKSKNLYDFVFYKKKTSIIPNGVDFNLFYPYNKSIIQNRILWLANPDDPRKNYNLIKDALTILDDKNLEFINPYPILPDNFPKYLNNCFVFVLTSYNEGSPNVIKEAMACNISIVSTDVGDVRKVIGNTEGCYITSFEPEDVVSKIKKALAFGKRTTGRQRLIELGLDSQSVAKKIIGIYKKVLEKR